MTTRNTEQAQAGGMLRPAEAARFLGVSVQTAYRWAAIGRLPRPLKLGPRTSGWRLADLQAFLDRMEQEADGGSAA